MSTVAWANVLIPITVRQELVFLVIRLVQLVPMRAPAFHVQLASSTKASASESVLMAPTPTTPTIDVSSVVKSVKNVQIQQIYVPCVFHLIICWQPSAYKSAQPKLTSKRTVNAYNARHPV